MITSRSLNLHSLKIFNLTYSIFTTSVAKCLSSSRNEAEKKIYNSPPSQIIKNRKKKSEIHNV